MKTLLLLAIVSLTSCTVTTNPDGTYNASVDPVTATAIATKVLATK